MASRGDVLSNGDFVDQAVREATRATAVTLAARAKVPTAGRFRDQQGIWDTRTLGTDAAALDAGHSSSKTTKYTLAAMHNDLRDQ